MIFIGYDDPQKNAEIERYRTKNAIRKTVVISGDEFPLLVPNSDQVCYSDVIMYVTFYRLLQEIDNDTLIIINECLRTQNRYDLSYNCIRNFLNQTTHQLIFQHLPQIDTRDDFMILFDFATRSQWKRRKFDIDLILDNAEIIVHKMPLVFSRIDVPTSATTKLRYAKSREELFLDASNKDPHSIPRNLHLIGGADKLAYIDNRQSSLFADDGFAGNFVARNKRLKRPSIVTYKDARACRGPYTIIDFPHRFIEFCDFIRRTGQSHSNALVVDLKVDRWYYNRYTEWKERMHATYASIQQQ